MVLRKGLLAQVGAEAYATYGKGSRGGRGRSGAGTRAGGIGCRGGGTSDTVGSGGGNIEVRESVTTDEQDTQ